MNIYLLVAWFLVLLVAEFFWRLRVEYEQKRIRIVKNLSYFLLNTLLNKFVYVYLLVVAEKNSLIAVGPMNIYRTIAIIIFLDLMIYYWHRLNHTSALLWRFHKLHHSDRDMDVSTAVRFHFLEFFFSAIFRSTLVFFLGITLSEMIIFDLIVMFFVLFQHSNLKLGKIDNILNAVLVTPIHHHYHHSNDPRELRSHYGSIFSFWDRFHKTQKRENKIEAVKIGLRELEETPTFIGGLWRSTRS